MEELTISNIDDSVPCFSFHQGVDFCVLTSSDKAVQRDILAMLQSVERERERKKKKRIEEV